MLDVCPDDPGGRLWPERPRLALLGPRREPEELLLDDVGDLAHAALEHGGLLEQRRLDRPVAVPCGQIGGDRLEPDHRGPLGGEDVARPARGSKSGHRAESSRATSATSSGRAGRW